MYVIWNSETTRLFSEHLRFVLVFSWRINTGFSVITFDMVCTVYMNVNIPEMLTPDSLKCRKAQNILTDALQTN